MRNYSHKYSLLTAVSIAAAVNITPSRAAEFPCPNVDVTKTFILPDTKTLTEHKGKDGMPDVVVGDLTPAMTVHRTIDWKNNIMCDERTALEGYKISQAKVCNKLDSGERVVGDSDTLVITDANKREFKFLELPPADAVVVGRSFHNACTGHGEFAGLQTKTYG